MKRIVVRQVAARADLREIALHIGRRSPQSARRFLQSANRTISRLATNPGIGEPYSPRDRAFAGLRLCAIDRSRSYLVVYRAADDRVEIPASSTRRATSTRS